jgi:hypothetical protein
MFFFNYRFVIFYTYFILRNYEVFPKIKLYNFIYVLLYTENMVFLLIAILISVIH